MNLRYMLSEQVLEEAIREKANLLFSYHPPIFVPLKRLTQKSMKERIIVKCIENRIAVYSPHTVYDALEDGVNNWLAKAFGKIEY
jgi:putative NIF3 family GTP cyclohydrolase 1 type 2